MKFCHLHSEICRNVYLRLSRREDEIFHIQNSSNMKCVAMLTQTSFLISHGNYSSIIISLVEDNISVVFLYEQNYKTYQIVTARMSSKILLHNFLKQFINLKSDFICFLNKLFCIHFQKYCSSNQINNLYENVLVLISCVISFFLELLDLSHNYWVIEQRLSNFANSRYIYI